MPLLVLTACTSFTTPAGEERVRGALWVEDVLTNYGDAAMVIVANSPLPCEPADVEDQPATPADEVASAQSWWLAQLQAALTREGAAVVVLWLGGMPAEGGQFVLDPTGWLTTQPGRGGAAAFRVDEAVVTERDGAIFVYQATEATVDRALEGSMTASTTGPEPEVRFDLGAWSGTAITERCANPALAWALTEVLDGESLPLEP